MTLSISFFAYCQSRYCRPINIIFKQDFNVNTLVEFRATAYYSMEISSELSMHPKKHLRTIYERIEKKFTCKNCLKSTTRFYLFFFTLDVYFSCFILFVLRVCVHIYNMFVTIFSHFLSINKQLCLLIFFRFNLIYF